MIYNSLNNNNFLLDNNNLIDDEGLEEYYDNFYNKN